MNAYPNVVLPPRKYLKDRAISDDTFSEYAQGWDDALYAVMDILKKMGIPFVQPTDNQKAQRP